VTRITEANVEATALGQMRTAAMTGVGTRRLAPEDARCLALIGTGKQALPNAAASRLRHLTGGGATPRSTRRCDQKN